MHRTTIHLLVALIALPACGGGGSGALGGGSPLSIAYLEDDAVYRTDVPLEPNPPIVEGGAATGYAVAPALPTGIALDPVTGTIEGVPTEASPRRSYVVTAGHPEGPASTTIAMEVRWPAAKSLARQEAFDEADLRHFLLRTHWGLRQGNWDALVAVGLEPYLDAILAFPALGTTEHEQQADEFLTRPNDPPGQEGLFPTHFQLAQWWLVLMVLNPNTFQEVLAFHWHDHFATSSVVLQNGNTWWMKEHVNLFRRHGAGNLRTLLVAVARDGAMLRWLDGLSSTVQAPNENFAREFFELFTLGVDNGYDQADILEAARAFTGYRGIVLDPDTGLFGVDFAPFRHDPDSKVLFGETIPGQNVGDDYDAVVDITLRNRNVAGWIARSLLERFCRPDPPEELVADVAAMLEDGDWELAPVLKALFLSEAFYAGEARGGLVKGPVAHGIGFVNATGLVVPPPGLGRRLCALGQLPTLPPTVNGWPSGSQWLSAQGMVDRANLLKSAITNRLVQDSLGIDVAALLPPGSPAAGEVVDALAGLLGVEITASQRLAYVQYLDTERQPDGSVLPSPFDAGNPTHVDDRVRGLLYTLGQHPRYLLR